METRFDVIIFGAGPAGLTAGIYLARARMKTLIIDTGTAGGQMNMTHHVANYPGVAGASGAEIAMTMKRQAESFGCRIITQADILKVDLEKDEKMVEIDDEGVFTAKVVILSPGGVPRTLGIPSEAQFKGRGISYCATCDGDFFTDKDIAVIGGGNSALEEAVSLTKYASSVTIIHEFDNFQAQPWAVEDAQKNPKIRFLLAQEIIEFTGENGEFKSVISIDKKTGERIVTHAAGAFLFIGYIPNTSWLKGVVTLNDRGEILADELMRTNIPGVFAAGDARQKRYRQITTAVGDGTVAAIAAVEFISTNKKP